MLGAEAVLVVAGVPGGEAVLVVAGVPGGEAVLGGVEARVGVPLGVVAGVDGVVSARGASPTS